MLMIPIRPKEAERRIFFMVIQLLGSREKAEACFMSEDISHMLCVTSLLPVSE